MTKRIAKSRTQKQRRRETQMAVLAAAIDMLVEAGHIGFSSSGVAARARVSRGALEHYFPTRNDLLTAAARHAMEEAIRHARMLAARAGKSADVLEKFLLDSEHFFFSPVYLAMIELAFAAHRDAALRRVQRPIVIQAREILNQIWIDTLSAAGYSRANAQRFIELTHLLLRGVFFASTWLPYDIDRKAVMRMWLQLAPATLKLASRNGKRRRRAALGQGLHRSPVYRLPTA